jgi:hypothetical protein
LGGGGIISFRPNETEQALKQLTQQGDFKTIIFKYTNITGGHRPFPCDFSHKYSSHHAFRLLRRSISKSLKR